MSKFTIRMVLAATLVAFLIPAHAAAKNGPTTNPSPGPTTNPTSSAPAPTDECDSKLFQQYSETGFKVASKNEAFTFITKIKTAFKAIKVDYRAAKQNLRKLGRGAKDGATEEVTPPTMPELTSEVWVDSSASIAISSGGTVATQNSTSDGWGPGVAGGEQMVTGVHYWEVSLVANPDGNSRVMFGVSRPGLDREKPHWNTNDAWYFHGDDGGLYGDGKIQQHRQGQIDVGDKIGVLLDLTAGSLKFYRNGKLYGPGFPSGVTGPVVRTVEMYTVGTVVSLDVAATRPQ